MTKAKDKSPHHKETKETHNKETKETKDKEPKGKSNLVGRVKKVIKKSRRKLGEEKFEKELQRTIEFLAQLQVKLDNPLDGRKADEAGKKTEKKPAKGAGKNAEKKTARNETKKAKPGRKSGRKPSAKGANKKGNGMVPKSGSAALAAESVIAPQPETQSMNQQFGDQQFDGDID